MALIFYVGTFAAIFTTGSFVPQIIKIKKQGGEDLSYLMLFIYLSGTLLWLAYGLLLHAAAVIWANGITAVLVTLAITLKMSYAAQKSSARRSPVPESAK